MAEARINEKIIGSLKYYAHCVCNPLTHVNVGINDADSRNYNFLPK